MKEIIVDYVALSNRADEIDVKKENNLMREINRIKSIRNRW